uniref:Uncharacterized protein n=1 Tax=Peronospora matthiolae TaxID=2874970 RepID=A0AAV1T1H7_9STRA
MTTSQKYPSSSNNERHLRPLTTPCTARRPSCLRKGSAFVNGVAFQGSRLDELSTTKTITVRYSSKPKKTISFADQRGQSLVLKREFSREDAPVCCCEMPSGVTDDRMMCQRSSSIDKLIYETFAHQHLLSICVISLLGCALVGFRQTTK